MLGINLEDRRRYRKTVFAIVGALTLLNSLDLVSTTMGLGTGLSEANGAVLAVAARLGTGTLFTLALFKMVFVSGAFLVALLGVRSSDRRVKSRVVLVLLGLTFLLTVVLANNFYLLGSR